MKRIKISLVSWLTTLLSLQLLEMWYLKSLQVLNCRILKPIPSHQGKSKPQIKIYKKLPMVKMVTAMVNSLQPLPMKKIKRTRRESSVAAVNAHPVQKTAIQITSITMTRPRLLSSKSLTSNSLKTPYPFLKSSKPCEQSTRTNWSRLSAASWPSPRSNTYSISAPRSRILWCSQLHSPNTYWERKPNR